MLPATSTSMRSVRLWDGSDVPLGRTATRTLDITIASPGVVASLLKRPTLDRIIRHYAHGEIGLEGGTLIDLAEGLAWDGAGKRLKSLSKLGTRAQALAVPMGQTRAPGQSRAFAGDHAGERPQASRRTATSSASTTMSATTSTGSSSTRR